MGDLAFDLLHGKLLVEYDHTLVSAPRLQEAIQDTGLKCEPWRDEDSDPPFWQRNGRLILAGLSGLSLFSALLWQGLTSGHLLQTMLAHEHAGHDASAPVIILCLIAMGCGAVHFLPKAYHSFRRIQPDMNALMAISMTGAILLEEWIEGATLSFLFALAALLETYSIARARRAVEALMEVTPGEASVVHHDHEHRMPVSKVSVGSVVRVKPGERIPFDGVICAGCSDVNQAMITGESARVWKAEGDSVFAGTMNGDGSLDLRTSKPASDSTLARIVRMVEGIQHRRAPSEQFVEKFSRYYTPIMMLLALLVAVIQPLAFGEAWNDSFYDAMVILLISCPCALVISTPVSIVAALSSAAKNGVLIKGGAYLEEAARLKAIAFDKTGVLTAGEPEVVALEPLNGYSAEEILGRLAALEFRSEHPLARAVLRYAKAKGIAEMQVTNFQALQGKGAEGQIAGEKFWAGSLRLMQEKGFPTAGLEDRVGTVMACGTDREAWALVVLADPVRPESGAIIREIKSEGMDHVIMLTGDNKATANIVGKQVNVDEIRAELLPEDKSNTITDLRAKYGKVAMVGDGINDAQAMAASSLGIAIGGAGIDVVMETADVILMSDGLSKLPFLLRHARRTVAVIQQNVGIALMMKAVFLILAFLKLATLWMAIAADMGATLLVTFNGLRMLRAKR